MTTNYENPKKRNWPVIRKTQIAGAIIGLLLTVVMLVFVKNADSHNLGPIYLLLGISLPSLPLYWPFKALGMDWFQIANYNDYPHSFWEFALLTTGANMISYFAMGTVVGWIISKLKRRE